MKDCGEVAQSGVQSIGVSVSVSLCLWQRLWHASTNRQVSRGTKARVRARVGLSRQNCCMHIHYGISWRYFKCLRLFGMGMETGSDYKFGAKAQPVSVRQIISVINDSLRWQLEAKWRHRQMAWRGQAHK